MYAPLTLKLNRLVWALLITFVMADTCPHPRLSPGLMATLGNRTLTLLSHQATK
jgi:hypothetical protein